MANLKRQGHPYAPISAIRLPPATLAAIDEANTRLGVRGRSKLIRDAIDHYLKDLATKQDAA